MTLVSKLNGTFDRVYAISDRLGVPSHCDFTFIDRTDSLVKTVTPRPRVSSPPVNKLTAWRESGVEVNNDVVYVTHISRTFDSLKKGTFCNINGKPYTIMWLDTEKAVTFDILARPERSR